MVCLPCLTGATDLKSQLEPDDMDVTNRRACLEGTCVSTLQTVVDWLLDDTPERILWLYGAAGTGKTTVARSIQDRMRRLSRLGGYLRFERGKSAPRTAIRTMAYQLARFDSRIAERVTATLQSTDINSVSLEDQFELLIQRSFAESGELFHGPVVLILDALDECGDAPLRKDLLQLLSQLPKLPRNVRVLITSRPENDPGGTDVSLHESLRMST